MPRLPKQLSFDDYRLRSGRGGPRPGAGRPPESARPPVHHVRRPPVPVHCPSHVTLRVLAGTPSLRTRRFVRELRRSLRLASQRPGFRVVHYSVQKNHLHLLVESAGKEALGRGMMAVGARVARVVQRVFGLLGAVMHGRYHLRILRTPREVRNALAYVLLNVRKHWRERHGALPPVGLDHASSARWFDGWRWTPASREPPGVPPEVAPARTWLLRTGGGRHGRGEPSVVTGGLSREVSGDPTRTGPASP